MIRLINFMTSLFVISSSILFAQDKVPVKKWSLVDCIDYALSNNIDVQLGLLDIQTSKIDLKQAKNERLPELYGSFNNSQNYGRYLDPFNNTFATDATTNSNLGVDLGATLFTGNRINNKIKADKLNLQVSLLENEKLKNDISILVSTQYLEILYQKELVELVKKQLELSQTQLKKTQILIEAGKRPKGDLYKIRTQISNDKVDLIDQENALVTSFVNLSQTLNLEYDPQFDIQEVEHMTLDEQYTFKKVEDIYKTSLNTMPEIKAQQYRIKVSKALEKIQEGAILPTLSMGGNLSTGYSSSRQLPEGQYHYMDQLMDNYNSSVYLSLSIPIFKKFQNRTNIQKAKIDKMQSELTLVKLKNNLFKEVQNAHSDALAAFASYNAAKQAVTSSNESYVFVKEKYNAGSSDIYELNIASLDRLEAYSNLLRSKYTFIFRTKILDFYTGKRISLN
ncbi:TolC family protein [Flammeovirga aprica]|uniref:TolC family protein n=1 Tax=Flammeovirga aprica JL-4 TaxID=694437 RepID=A0A7X9NZI3_9BACT|nr:TolC family protein [Flammeovirga aprica]NME66789.1 TolC family protein [Flammeovirga aprica JL-4]